MNPDKQPAETPMFIDKTFGVLAKWITIRIKNIPHQLSVGLRNIRFTDLAILVIGICLAGVLRYSLISFKSGDFTCCVENWFNTIVAEGKGAFRHSIANLHPNYLHILYVIHKIFPELPALFAVKLPSIIADFVCAWFVFLIVRLKYESSPLPMLSFFAVLFAPTVILNGAFWGQSDSIYTSALVASVFFLLTKRNWLACLAYGLAITFKLQAIFLAPFFLALFIKRNISWKELLCIPLVYFVTILPSWILGRSLLELLGVYVNQTSMYASLTLNAPTIYAWFPESAFSIFSTFGVIFAACITFIYLVVIYKSKATITRPLIVQLALISAILIPFVLPKMHERYFFAADILSIAFAFYFPKLFFVPIAINLASFFAYQQFLFGMKQIPDSLLAIVILCVIVILIRHWIISLYQSRLNS